MQESAFVFNRHNVCLSGITHPCKNNKNVGVLIVVGGPQTKVGSHRQFVLLARYLAANGIPAMRFDYSGMGDSDGEYADFLSVTEDIDEAIKQCQQRLGVSKVILWGLCDAASSTLIYAKNKPLDCVAGVVLLNPWVRSEQGQAKTLVKQYYWQRIQDKQFWLKLIKLDVDIKGAFLGFTKNILAAFSSSGSTSSDVSEIEVSTQENYIEHMLAGLQKIDTPILLVISGDDLTAAEFEQKVQDDKRWQQALADKQLTKHTMPTANHTFSTLQWRSEVEHTTLSWINTHF
ncbi:hydrolase 1, exosortase A system-associated [Aestuariibacter sp. AA17]|uniref:Hydrolase 1, exosortase A system-associated n=1 Tax=Fluctibacter corallii TaxID=2984329 RepID=A0ABT3ABH2_9ALTE|nr:hydrolase 1, exosortase A system-associated [Aestuariibacter sp. AA17]MCV2886026.1 hydrolase 1, exosortase A system-associated [Aestuariibacter sp. AA17]